MPRKSTPADVRFWRFVSKTDTCWLWNGSVAREYGRFDRTRAHRFSYVLHHGPIPDGIWVLHHCDVKLCVNPAHLYLGTRTENTRDAMERGLMALTPEQSRLRYERRPCGERHGSHKLTGADVAEIRRLLLARVLKVQIAHQFGVTQTTIGDISAGRTWDPEYREAGQ